MDRSSMGKMNRKCGYCIKWNPIFTFVPIYHTDNGIRMKGKMRMPKFHFSLWLARIAQIKINHFSAKFMLWCCFRASGVTLDTKNTNFMKCVAPTKNRLGLERWWWWWCPFSLTTITIVLFTVVGVFASTYRKIARSVYTHRASTDSISFD